MYGNDYPELKKEEGYTSPASPLPTHELKMLQEYIHSANLQNLGSKLPANKKQIILLKFFINRLKFTREMVKRSSILWGKYRL